MCSSVHGRGGVLRPHQGISASAMRFGVYHIVGSTCKHQTSTIDAQEHVAVWYCWLSLRHRAAIRADIQVMSIVPLNSQFGVDSKGMCG